MRYLPLAILALALGLLVPGLDTVPGLEGDEAWTGDIAAQIGEGARPLAGLTDYTGPLYAYLFWPLFRLFGPVVWALRAVAIAAALLSLLLYGRLVGRLFGPAVAVVASLVLCTAPLFSVSGRCALDMALYPPLALGALLLVTPPAPLVGAGRAAAAGLLLGLGVWNHVCFAPILLLFAAAALVALRRKRLSRAGLVAGLLGAALGLLPALLLARGRAGPGFAPAALVERLWLGVTVWPRVLLEVLHGDILFQRFVGRVAWPTPWVAPVLLAVALVALLFTRWRDEPPLGRAFRRLILFTALALVLTAALTPHTPDRRFVPLAYPLPIVIAGGWRLLARRGYPRLAGALVAALALLQVARTLTCFHHAFRQSGGAVSAYRIGTIAETSNHFLRADRLYARLVSDGTRRVVTEFQIGMPLRFYDLRARRLGEILFSEELSPERLAALLAVPDTTAIFYSGGIRRFAPDLAPSRYRLTELGGFVIARPR